MHKRSLFWLCGLLLLAACAEPTEKITITGSSTIAPLASELARAYEKKTGIRVDVQTGGSSRGLADVRMGLADIGMVSRKLQASEADLSGYLLALDGLAIIVHRDNPITTLSDNDISEFYTGAQRRWPSGEQIVVVSKAEGRSTLEVFLEHLGLDNQAIKADIIIGDNQQAIKTVSGNANAIAYVSLGSAEYEANNGVPIKLLGFAGTVATTAAVQSGSYPATRELNFVSAKKPSKNVEHFLAFSRSPQAAPLIRAQFFIPAHAQ